MAKLPHASSGATFGESQATSETPTENVEIAPSPASEAPSASESPAPAPPAPQPQVIVQMVENKAAEPTPGLSEVAEGGKFKHNGKTYDAFLREIK